MGALIAARYAARAGRRHVRHVVLVSPPVYLDPNELADPLDRRVQGFYLEAYRYVRTHQDFTLRNAADRGGDAADQEGDGHHRRQRGRRS